MFGEMIGLSLGTTWQAQGATKDAIVVELGPGSWHFDARPAPHCACCAGL
jgi:SAM-dependent MidA family methyltransferase